MNVREAHRTHLATIYSTELQYLTEQGLTAEISFTGGECAAIQADFGGRRLLATNTDANLIDSEDEAAESSWYIAIVTIDDTEGDEQIAEGEHTDFALAHQAALESLERGDFVD